MPTIINLENIENDLGAQINNSIEYINKGMRGLTSSI